MVEFIVEPKYGPVPLEVKVINTSSPNWLKGGLDFGDGNKFIIEKGAEQVFYHTYNEPGTYRIILKLVYRGAYRTGAYSYITRSYSENVVALEPEELETPVTPPPVTPPKEDRIKKLLPAVLIGSLILLEST